MRVNNISIRPVQADARDAATNPTATQNPSGFGLEDSFQRVGGGADGQVVAASAADRPGWNAGIEVTATAFFEDASGQRYEVSVECTVDRENAARVGRNMARGLASGLAKNIADACEGQASWSFGWHQFWAEWNYPSEVRERYPDFDMDGIRLKPKLELVGRRPWRGS